MDVWIQSYLDHHIDATVQLGVDSVRWRFTGFYRHPEVAKQYCKGVIENVWKEKVENDSIEGLSRKIRGCSRNLMSWDSMSFGNITRRIKELEMKLKAAMNMDITSASKKCMVDLWEKLEELLKKEETLWKQRGKAVWLKEGDRNTPFFHARATERRQHKEIKRLKTVTKEVTVEPMEIKRVVLEYFSSIFTSSRPQEDVIKEIITCLEPKVTEAMNLELL
ncbi:hypothetical protein Sango_2429700 [Sesamum angolense]|uniref:Uncharacterized protein n=1 Tax=Sesamum angolense TaxID=2727404 RepID=A0AAE1W7K7_9LAMI|nr:hypothetical protein Sango_2429700 [Sesamum angolense]